MTDFAVFDRWFAHLKGECKRRTLLDWDIEFCELDADYYFDRGETSKELVDWIIADRKLDDCSTFPHVSPEDARRWRRVDRRHHKLQVKALTEKRPVHAKHKYCKHENFDVLPAEFQARRIAAQLRRQARSYFERIGHLIASTDAKSKQGRQQQAQMELEKLKEALLQIVASNTAP